jgi:hypothetical protein
MFPELFIERDRGNTSKANGETDAFLKKSLAGKERQRSLAK